MLLKFALFFEKMFLCVRIDFKLNEFRESYFFEIVLFVGIRGVINSELVVRKRSK